jgi:hypothetical protein
MINDQYRRGMRRAVGLAILGCAAGAASLAQLRAATGDFTTIDYPGATSTGVRSINDRGDMAGNYVATSGVSYGFLLRAGTFTSIEYPGAKSTNVYGATIWQGNCDVASHSGREVADQSARSNIVLSRITFSIEYPIRNCPAKSRAASFKSLYRRRTGPAGRVYLRFCAAGSLPIQP